MLERFRIQTITSSGIEDWHDFATLIEAKKIYKKMRQHAIDEGYDVRFELVKILLHDRVKVKGVF
jgi:hypothetical protein